MDSRRVADLEMRLSKGDSYLEGNPDDEEAITLYWRLWGEYMELATLEEIRAELAAVTLQLPNGVTWKRDADSPEQNIVRVLYHDEPQAENEMSYDALSALVDTVKMAREGR